MWWPVQICFHLLHPRHLALHQELHTQRPCSHLHIRNALGFRNLHKKSLLESSVSIIVNHLHLCRSQFEDFRIYIWSGWMIWGQNAELHSPYLRPLSWSWLTQGWALQLQHCFWPKPETHTPPRHWGPLQWLSVCYHKSSQALGEKTVNIQYIQYMIIYIFKKNWGNGWIKVKQEN